MKCISCGKEFESSRSDAKFCSPTCRSRVSRLSVADKGELSVATGSNATDNSATGNSVTDNATDKPKIQDVVVLDLVKDLGLDLKKDLGITGWTPQGVFLCDVITVDQVRNLSRLVYAKNGWKQKIFMTFGESPHGKEGRAKQRQGV